MSEEQQQVYAQGYHVGYEHGLQAAKGESGGGPGAGHPFNLIARYPETQSRLLMFFCFIRGFLLIPHYIVLSVLGFAAFWVMVFAWFAVVFTGTYPKVLWEYLTGVMRWSVRCQAYVFALTDEYPPFTLN